MENAIYIVQFPKISILPPSPPPTEGMENFLRDGGLYETKKFKKKCMKLK